MGILILSSLPFQIHKVTRDPVGRFVTASGNWEGRTLNVTSLYVPPKLHSIILADLGPHILCLSDGDLLMGVIAMPLLMGTWTVCHSGEENHPGNCWRTFWRQWV